MSIDGHTTLLFQWVLSQNILANLGPTHWSVVKRILRYFTMNSKVLLKIDYKTTCRRKQAFFTPLGYTDFDWAGDSDS
jgi:hypothetical protein